MIGSPVIWIIIPFMAAGLLLFVNNERIVKISAIFLVLCLSLAAGFFKQDFSITVAGLGIKITPSLHILGRELTLEQSAQPLILLIYSSLLLWFIYLGMFKIPDRTIPIILLITTTLIAAISVKPFLYAALLIEIALLISVPLLYQPESKDHISLLRFITFQTLAMPFILFSGWLLTGGSPAGSAQSSLPVQAASFLGLGFVFLLAVFPFNTWIPMLAEKVAPYASAFTLFIFSTISLIFGLYFFDNYPWIRESSQLPGIIRVVGMITIVSSGLLVAVQTNLKRNIAHAILMETGFSLLAISFLKTGGLVIFFVLLIQRTITIPFWSAAISTLTQNNPDSNYSSAAGLGKRQPLAGMLLILCHFSIAEVPLLAGFASHQSIWQLLGQTSLPLAVWYGIALIGYLIGGLRSFNVLFISGQADTLPPAFPWYQRLLVSMGLLTLLILGIFQQMTGQLALILIKMFKHLG